MTPDKDKTEHALRLILSPLPFPAGTGTALDVTPGATIADLIRRQELDERDVVAALLDGTEVSRDNWAATAPSGGSVLMLRLKPKGGGGRKNPLRAVITLALMAAAPQISGAILGALSIPAGAGFLGMTAGRLLTAGIGLLGRLGLNALAPPGLPKFAGRKESPTLFLAGARNDLVPFGRVPRVLGTHRMVPPMGARPFTETIGQDQYIRMLFVWGYCPLRITDLKIGETPLEEFSDVEVETLTGDNDDAPMTLYGTTVLQNDLQVTLTQAGGYQTRTTEKDADEISVDITFPRGLSGFAPSGARTSRSVKIEVQYSPAGLGIWSAGSLSFTAIAAQTALLSANPAAHVVNSTTFEVLRIDRVVADAATGVVSVLKGQPHRQGIDAGSPAAPAVPAGFLAIARVERRSGDPAIIPSTRITDERNLALVGSAFQASGDFLPGTSGLANRISIAAGGISYTALDITGRQAAALRTCVRFKVPRGQYDVRVRRLTADDTTGNVFDETVWTALRSHRNENPVRMPGLAMTALRIRASDQLNGVIERFNGVVSSILPDWTGSTWTPQVTSNPAALFRHVLQGEANARPLADSRIDLARLQEWHSACQTEGRAFNMVVDYDTSVRQILSDIAAAGRASPAVIDGKWSIVEDRPQTVPVQHFTPRNTFGFRGEKSFDERPHALRIRFVNREKGWLEDERLVYDDGYDEATATRYEGFELPGVTDPAQVWKDGRYHIATARLRPETFSFTADLEHIACTRGDLIMLTHDVPLFGLASARVASVATGGGTALGVTLDAAVEMEAGKTYAVRFRKSDGSSAVHTLTTVAGISKTITFLTPCPVAEAPAPGDLALFGESGTESTALIVRAIEPGQNLTARLTCVDAAPAVFDAASGTIPEFASHVSLPTLYRRPPAPVITGIQSGDEAIVRNADGSIQSRIIIALSPPENAAALGILATIRPSGTARFATAEIAQATPHCVILTGVEEGGTYDIGLAYTAAGDILSPTSLISGHFVVGASGPPSDVAAINLIARGNALLLSWEAVPDIDLSHYHLRFTPALAGGNWGSAIDVIERIPPSATSVSLPASVGTYLIKAVDAGGRESINAVAAVATVDSLSGLNNIAVLDEHPDFLGSLDSVVPVGSVLQLAGSDSIDDWADLDAVPNTDMGLNGITAEGIYDLWQVYDLGGVFTLTAQALIDATGLDINTTSDEWQDTDTVENWDGAVDAGKWSAQLEIAVTNDDPFGIAPVWGQWMPFIIGDYTARGLRFRLRLRSLASGITPAVTGLSVRLDMADRIFGKGGVACPSGGLGVTYDNAFYDVPGNPAVAINPRNMASGDYYALTAIGPGGFTIRFYNSAGTGIARTFDYVATGFGFEA